MKRSSFIYKQNHVFIEEDNPSDKSITLEKELDAAEVDGIGNLVDSPSSSIKNAEILK